RHTCAGPAHFPINRRSQGGEPSFSAKSVYRLADELLNPPPPSTGIPPNHFNQPKKQRPTMTNRSIARFSMLAAGMITLPAVSYAGQEIKETKEVVEKAKESCISGDLGIN